MTGPSASSASVLAFFEREIAEGRPLLPDPATVSGLGTHRKYLQAVTLMADPTVRNVLDVGCNRGSVEFLFHRMHPGKAAETQIHGLDVSRQAIERATDLRLPNCRFAAYDGSSLPYASNTFDLVVMVEVIEHVMDKERLLREVNRVLTPLGMLFLTTPNPESWALKTQLTLWRILHTIFRKPLVAKDAFISMGALVRVLSDVGFGAAERGCWFVWPHLFIEFLGWSILPPLPPRVLYWYQNRCLSWLKDVSLPGFLARRIHWSSSALVRKGL
jgi:2-polyprenyl-3-methyl-5-hydroxy-6-metoxy-1,4-benzoquinol methylase